MKNQIEKAIVSVVEALNDRKCYFAAKFLSEKMVVRGTRPRLQGGKLPAKGSNLHISLVIGRPNFAQRLFIKACKKAGEPFPVKRVQLKFTK
jgi:hypothetical protein